MVGVSAAAISQYESGDARPRPATLAELAMQLGMPVGFFASTGRSVPSLDATPGFFRSLRRTTQLDRDAALAEAAILSDLVSAIEQRVVLPQLDLPQDMAVQRDTPIEEIEDRADELRRRWDMGQAPVKNVVRLLERHGIVAARLSLARDVDAFSWPIPGRPLVILGTDKGAKDRSRLDAAHELAHLVLHFSDPESANPAMERQAFRFGAAFLLPAAAFIDEFGGSRIDWTRLLELKVRWQVSMAAMLYRARDLQIISPSGYESAMKQMSRRGWRVREPGDLGAPERPALLRKAAELLEASGGSIDDLATAVELPVDKVRALLGADEARLPVLSI
jgi:Zn-dependent peptidase ImmA (M78 family)